MKKDPKIKVSPVPSKWDLFFDEFFSVNISIEKRLQSDGKTYKYAVSSGSSFLSSKHLEFILVHRDNDNEMALTRFKTFNQVLNIYKKFIKKCLSQKAQSNYEMAIQHKYNHGRIINNDFMTNKLNDLRLDKMIKNKQIDGITGKILKKKK